MSYKRRKIIKILSDRGFRILREGGNHTIFEGPEGQRLPVERHREISPLTARAIAEEAGID